MSSIYITEPITKGKVILKTTFGDLDVELWSKETPKACRNFIQLCLEGYYDNCIFNRIIKGFIAQTGDPTGTGFGGESIYGEPFPDEFHSRIRFSHRGIVAMATSEPNTNQSQFFITLDKCPDLQGKHTIFGKVTGDTIFNALKLNDFEVDENEAPLYPPKILSAEIIVNPFDDIVPREIKKTVQQTTEEKPKPKGKKNFSLLSFGEEAEQEEQETEQAASSLKMKSQHKYSDDPLERETAEEIERNKANKEKKVLTEDDKRKRMKESIAKATDNKEDFSKSMREKINKKKKGEKRTRSEEAELEEESMEVSKEAQKEERLKAMREEQKKLMQEIKSINKTKEEEKTQSEGLSLLEEQRAKYIQSKRQKGVKPDESKILAKLSQFRKKIEKVEDESASTTKDLESVDDNDDSWRRHTLKFEKEKRVKDPMAWQDDADRYTTFDPLKFSNVKPLSQHKRRLQGSKNLEEW